MIDVIIYPCPNLKWTLSVKGLVEYSSLNTGYY